MQCSKLVDAILLGAKSYEKRRLKLLSGVSKSVVCVCVCVCAQKELHQIGIALTRTVNAPVQWIRWIKWGEVGFSVSGLHFNCSQLAVLLEVFGTRSIT